MLGGVEGVRGGEIGVREGKGREDTLEARAEGSLAVPKSSEAFWRSTSLTF